MLQIIALATVVLNLLSLALATRVAFSVQELRRHKQEAREILHDMRQNHGLAVDVPTMLPRTYPDNIVDFGELPHHIQRAIAQWAREVKE